MCHDYLAECHDPLNRRFHITIAKILASDCSQVRRETGLDRIALRGGVFQNHILLERMITRFGEMGFHVYINRQIPSNDGSLSFGQAAVAVAQMKASADQV